MRKLVTTILATLLLLAGGTSVAAAPYDFDSGVLNSTTVPNHHAPIKPLVNTQEQPATWTAPYADEEDNWTNPVVAPEDSQTMGGSSLPPQANQPKPCGVLHSDCVPTPKRDKITPVVDTTTEEPTWTEPTSEESSNEEEQPEYDSYEYSYQPYYYNYYYYYYYYGYPQPYYYSYW